MINRLVIGCVLVGLATALTCHYSCSSCVSSLYSQCLSCPSNALTVIQNPTTTPSQYWPSVYPTGSCVETLATASNALGILLVIIVVGVCIAVRTKESFYLLLTLQTIGLFNLLEIAWVNPIGYVLQSLQHFMIMNTLGSGYKADDYLLMASGNHRLHDYLKTSAAAPNLILLAVFSIVAIALLIVICIVSLKRKKQAPLEEK